MTRIDIFIYAMIGVVYLFGTFVVLLERMPEDMASSVLRFMGSSQEPKYIAPLFLVAWPLYAGARLLVAFVYLIIALGEKIIVTGPWEEDEEV